MRLPIPIGYALVSFATLASSAQAADSEEHAIEAVRELGGTVTRDDKAPGKPVRSVVFKCCCSPYPKPVDLRVLGAFTRLKSLELTCVEIRNGNLDHIKKLTSLESLTLVATGIDDDGVRQLKLLPNLQKLHLVFCTVSDTGLRSLSDFPSLQEVKLLGSSVTDEGIRELQQASPKLKIEAGNRNTAEKRARKHFAIPAPKPVTKKTIRAAILAQLPAGSTEDHIYSTLLTTCGIGKDTLSACYPKEDGKIVCQIGYDSMSGDIVHKHYAVTFHMNDEDKLRQVEVKEWFTGP